MEIAPYETPAEALAAVGLSEYAMSQENLDALRENYRRWAAGNWTDASLFDRYAVGVFPDPTPRPLYGKEALAAYMRGFLGSWDYIRMEATRYMSAGDSFVVSVRRVARGKGSGLELEDQAFHVWTFRRTSAIRLEVFDREAEALAAVGLSE